MFAILRRLPSTSKFLFWHADTTTIRMVLSTGSLLFAVGLAISFYHGGSHVWHPGFSLMQSYAPLWVWALAFLTHSALLSWRFLDPQPRVGWALGIGCFGLALWIITSVSINLSLDRFAPSTSAELVLCVFAAWDLLCTGLRKEILTP